MLRGLAVVAVLGLGSAVLAVGPVGAAGVVDGVGEVSLVESLGPREVSPGPPVEPPGPDVVSVVGSNWRSEVSVEEPFVAAVERPGWSLVSAGVSVSADGAVGVVGAVSLSPVGEGVPVDARVDVLDPVLAGQVSPFEAAVVMDLRSVEAVGGGVEPVEVVLDYSDLNLGGGVEGRLAVSVRRGCVVQQRRVESVEAGWSEVRDVLECGEAMLLPVVGLDREADTVTVLVDASVLEPEFVRSEAARASVDGAALAELERRTGRADALGVAVGEPVPVVSAASWPTDSSLGGVTSSDSVVADTTGVSEGSVAAVGPVVSSGPVVLALGSSSSGLLGDYSVPPVAAMGWSDVGLFSGSVEASYVVDVPVAAAGPVPSVSLVYSSGSIDGLNTSGNTQTGPVGAGWSLAAGGSITRSYTGTGCVQGHLCPGVDDSYSLTLNGRGARLVQLAGTTDEFRLQDDPYWRILRKFTASGTGDEEGEWWEVTTPDGTVHEFGLDGTRNSVEYGVISSSSCPFCSKGRVWNLDEVRDLSGNEVRFWYNREYNQYQGAGWSSTTPFTYVRASQLTSITYTEGSQPEPAARVLFDWEIRCGDASSTFGDCAILDLVDTPWDLWCKQSQSSCVQTAPTYWSASRLGSVMTQVRMFSGSPWATTATHDLAQSFPVPDVDGEGDVSNELLALYRVHHRAGGDYAVYGFDQIELESVATTSSSGVTLSPDGGDDIDNDGFVGSFGVGSWIRAHDVFLGDATTKPDRVVVRYASPNSVQIEIRVDSSTGPLLATVPLPGTGGWTLWDTVSVPLPVTVSGVRDVVVRGASSSGGSVNLNWIRFAATNKYMDLPGLAPVDYFSSEFAMLDNRVNHPAGVPAMTVPRIKKITNSVGGTTEFSYGTPVACIIPASPGWDDNHKHCYPAYDPITGGGGWVAWNRWVVTQTRTGDTFSGNPDVVGLYTYTNPSWAYLDTPSSQDSWSEFRGHNIVRVSTGDSTTETRFYQGMHGDKLANGTTKTVTVARSDGSSFSSLDELPLRGRPYETRQLDGGSNATQRFTAYHQIFTTSYGGFEARFVAPQAVRDITFGSSMNVEHKTETTYTGYGQVSTVADHGVVGIGGDERTTWINYANNASKWITAPCQEWSTDGWFAGTLMSSVNTYYDGSVTACAAPSLGRAILRRVFTGGGGSSDTILGYDSQGRVTAVLSAQNLADGQSPATTVYDSWHGRVLSQTNPAGHTKNFVYDTLGNISAQTGPNVGQIRRTYFDDYGRPTETWLPGNPLSGAPSKTFEYHTDSRPAWVVTDTRVGLVGSDVSRRVDYLNGRGQTIQTQVSGDAVGQRWLEFRSLDDHGRPDRVSVRYQYVAEPGTAYVIPNWSTAPSYNRTDYDPVGRITAQNLMTNGAISSTTSYVHNVWLDQHGRPGLSISTTDPEGNLSIGISDVYGSLVEVTEYNPSGPDEVTTYDYDGLSRLTNVSDAATPTANETSIIYDLGGRKISMTDPDTGSWAYTYDLDSNLKTQSDGSGITLWHGYDMLGRLAEVRQNSSTGTLIEDYKYDQIFKGAMNESRKFNVGTTTTAVDAFDLAGRPLTQRWFIPYQGVFRSDITYTHDGQIASRKFPGGDPNGYGETITYGHDPRTSLVSSATSSTAGQIMNYTDRDAQGRVVNWTRGAGTSTEWNWYHSVTQDPTLRWTTSPNGTPFYATYSHDNNHNVTQIINKTSVGAVEERQCFTYDRLDRLEHAFTGTTLCQGLDLVTGPAPYDRNYAYDEIGNLIYNSSIGNLHYGAGTAGPHAVTSTDSFDSYGYAADGMMSNRNPSGPSWEIMTYTPDNLLVWELGSPESALHLYDTTGSRVLTNRVGTENISTITLGGLFERQINNATGAVTDISYYQGPNGLAAMSINGNMTYVYTDYLGSVAATWNPSTGAIDRQRYYPFGDIRTTDDLDTTIGYTGQRRDVTGLMYYQSRYYDPHTGRFAQSDTIVPDPSNGQDFNRYTYVRNNPATYNDPTGHCTTPNGANIEGLGTQPCTSGGWIYDWPGFWAPWDNEFGFDEVERGIIAATVADARATGQWDKYTGYSSGDIDRSGLGGLYLKFQYCPLVCFSISVTGDGVWQLGVGELGLGASLTAGYSTEDPCSSAAAEKRAGLSFGLIVVGEGSVGIDTNGSGIDIVGNDRSLGGGLGLGFLVSGGPSRTYVIGGC